MVFQRSKKLSALDEFNEIFERELDGKELAQEQALYDLSRTPVWADVIKPWLEADLERISDFGLNIKSEDTLQDIGVKTLMAQAVFRKIEEIIEWVDGAEEALENVRKD